MNRITCARKDQRGYGRRELVSAAQLIVCRSGDPLPPVPAVVHNISAGGIALSSAAPLTAGEKVRVLLSFENSPAIPLMYRVAHARQLSEGWWTIGAATTGRAEGPCFHCPRRSAGGICPPPVSPPSIV